MFKGLRGSRPRVVEWKWQVKRGLSGSDPRARWALPIGQLCHFYHYERCSMFFGKNDKKDDQNSTHARITQSIFNTPRSNCSSSSLSGSTKSNLIKASNLMSSSPPDLDVHFPRYLPLQPCPHCLPILVPFLHLSTLALLSPDVFFMSRIWFYQTVSRLSSWLARVMMRFSSDSSSSQFLDHDLISHVCEDNRSTDDDEEGMQK